MRQKYVKINIGDKDGQNINVINYSICRYHCYSFYCAYDCKASQKKEISTNVGGTRISEK